MLSIDDFISTVYGSVPCSIIIIVGLFAVRVIPATATSAIYAEKKHHFNYSKCGNMTGCAAETNKLTV